MAHPTIFTYSLTVTQSVIDETCHVNNVVYVQWMQQAAIRHGTSIPEYKPRENTGWFVRKHRIEYPRPTFLGDEIAVGRWVTEWKHVRATRRYDSTRKWDARVVAGGETQWIFVELTTGRAIAVPTEIQALFPAPVDDADVIL